MKPKYPRLRLSTTEARDKLSSIILTVQEPRGHCILTRHGKSVAAIVSMTELKRIWKDHDIEDITVNGKRPWFMTFGRDGHRTTVDAAEAIRDAQLNRLMERTILKDAGIDEVPGGELRADVEVKEVVRKRRWWFW